MSDHRQFALLKQRRFLPFFIVQALGAFNDNIYRQAIIGLLFYLGIDRTQRTLYANLAPALFILPYFLFSALAGQIAEKLQKQRLIVITTTMEIAIMSLAAIGFLTQNMPVLLVALFCTGLQSTVFGPVKYSILPAILKSEELTGGNGLVEMGTSISILCGMIFGGLLFQIAGNHGPIAAAIAVIAIAITGNTVARWIPKTGASAPELKIRWNPVTESRAILGLTRKRPAVRNAIVGVSWFWFIGTVLTAQLPNYAQINLGGGQELYILALALFSIGTGSGALLCEKLSGLTVEIGLVPLGALGISACLLDLSFARSGTALATGLSILQFLAQAGSLRIAADLIGIGLFTGLFVVPLFAMIQIRTCKSELSRVIAGINIQNSIFIVTAAIIGIALQLKQVILFGHSLPMPGLSIPQIFLGLAIANIAVACWIFSIVPEFPIRFFTWLLISAFYKLHTHKAYRVPEEGPALLVCNHVSYMDTLILSAAITRPVRFVVSHKRFRMPAMRWIFHATNAIAIASAHEDTARRQQGLDRIDAALAEGELVCLFPEDDVTCDGEIARFNPEVEDILRRRPVTVVPLALRGLWSNRCRQSGSYRARMRLPQQLRTRITVMVGEWQSGKQTNAAALEQQVRALRDRHA